MALAGSDSDRQQLLEVLSGGGCGVLIRESARLVLQGLIEAEAAGVIGAACYERSPDRRDERNGHRPASADDAGR